jgi:hypothetical protein
MRATKPRLPLTQGATAQTGGVRIATRALTQVRHSLATSPLEDGYDLGAEVEWMSESQGGRLHTSLHTLLVGWTCKLSTYEQLGVSSLIAAKPDHYRY